MKITEVLTHCLSAPVDPPVWTAHERIDRAELVLFEVRTDDGLRGFGEVQFKPARQVRDLAAAFAPAVIGRDPLAHAAIWDTLFACTSPRPGGLGGWDGLPAPLPRGLRPQAMAAIAGIDIALWDIKGKAAGLPVYRLLGGERTALFTYATGGYYREGEPPEACAEELAGFVAQGFEAVKLKTGALSLADEVRRIRATREAIGPDVLLMLDMNAPYGVNDCIRFAHAVAPYDIHWLEEPLHWHLQPADFVQLAAASPIPLAHGEREWHRFTVRDFIDSGAIRFVQFDATRHAGFTESLRIAHHAAMRNVLVAPHTAPHLHAHLVSALGDAAFGVESHGAHDLQPIQHRLYRGGARHEGGRVHLADAPGFGVEIDWDYLRSVRSEPPA